MHEVKQSTATWCVTIPALGVYEQREGCTRSALSKAVVIAMEHLCVPISADPWSPGDPWCYERQVKLPPVLVPPRAKHTWWESLKCWRGKRCSHCDDDVKLLTVGDDDWHRMGVPIKIPGRRTLLERNRLGEFGVLRVSLFFDLLMGIPPEPNAVREWEASGGVAISPPGKSAPEPASAHPPLLYELPKTPTPSG